MVRCLWRMSLGAWSSRRRTARSRCQAWAATYMRALKMDRSRSSCLGRAGTAPVFKPKRRTARRNYRSPTTTTPRSSSERSTVRWTWVPDDGDDQRPRQRPHLDDTPQWGSADSRGYDQWSYGREENAVVGVTLRYPRSTTRGAPR